MTKIFKTVGIIIIVLSMGNIVCKTIALKDKQYLIEQDFNIELLNKIKSTEKHIGWINLTNPGYNCTHDAVYLWYRNLLFPCYLRNNKIENLMLCRISSQEQINQFVRSNPDYNLIYCDSFSGVAFFKKK